VREALGMPERTFRDAIRELLGAARLHRIATGLYVHADSVEVLATRVRAHLDAQGSLSPGDLKALAGVSRKHLVPLLEHLDRIGVTQRRGDDRIRA
jgi:selenocysteine-specific elongation factor